MPTPKLTRDQAQETINAIEACLEAGFSPPGHNIKPNAIDQAGIKLGKPQNTIISRLRSAKVRFALEPDWGKWQRRPDPQIDAVPVTERLDDVLRAQLKSGPRTLDELVSGSGANIGQVLDGIDSLARGGVNVRRSGDVVEIPREVEQSWTKGAALELTSRSDNTFVFGVAGDKHIASKYHRDDVLADLYRRFEAASVDAIFDAGNWIDGEASFNRYDILAHGLDAQLQLMADKHPRSATMTYAVWGDDHEGWYAQREGIDVGKYAEGTMRDAGHEWTDLGFMEAHVKLVNANTGKAQTMAVTHPGGGSAYATSYAPQKAIEALEGGEKPAVVLFGHWHKLEAINVRNVWAIQTGCCQDQTPFARRKRLDFHVGGVILRLEQDPHTGAIVGCAPEMLRYFVRSYYNNRWSHHGPVDRPERSRAGV